MTIRNNCVDHLYRDISIHSSSEAEFKLNNSIQKQNKDIVIVDDTITKLDKYLKMGIESKKIISEPNAGGSSVVSEALSVEYLCRRIGARDIVPEMEIQYFYSNCKKIDYIATIGTTNAGKGIGTTNAGSGIDIKKHPKRVGISVTRAMGYPTPQTFTVEDATRLCYKKLFGLVVARAGVSKKFRYSCSILHVLCQNRAIAQLMRVAFDELIREDRYRSKDMQITGDITIILTVCHNIPGVFTENFDCFD